MSTTYIPVVSKRSSDDHARLSSIASGSSQISDPFGSAIYGQQSPALNSSGSVVVGRVVWSGGESYDCTVRVGDAFDVGCTVAQTAMATASGSAMGSVPPPGSLVVVFLFAYGVSRGVVLGTLPNGWYYGGEKDSPKVLFGHGDDMDRHESDENAAFSSIPRDQLNAEKCGSTSGRPADMVPGDFLVSNEHDVGVYCGMFSSTLMGGPAYVRADRLDDEVKVRSTNMTVWTDPSVGYAYNDCGYLSTESKGFEFGGERAGKYGLKARADQKTLRSNPRIVEYGGFLGGVRSWYLSRPLKEAQTGYDVPKGVGGVASGHLSQSGCLALRTAGGISLERYDRIPVPRRVRDPWDPEGDDAKSVKYLPFRPFRHSRNEHLRSLELYDAESWESSESYLRFDEMEKDFRVDEESDLPESPGDEDLDPMGSMADLSRNKGRRAGIYIGENGSIILRDAWGSEIEMNGGEIRITASGSVTTFAGRSAVSIARESNVVKSVDGVAEVSSGRVVNIAGLGHVSIMGGNDKGGKTGGVVIEALGTGPTMNSDRDKSYDSGSVSGLSLVSPDGHVSISGKGVHVSALEEVDVSTGDSGSERSGDVSISTGIFTTTARDSRITGDGGVVAVSGSDVGMFSSGVVKVAGASTEIYNGKQLVTLFGVSMEDDPAENDVERARTEYKSYQNRTDDTPYSVGYVSEHVFALPGTSKDYSTDAGMEAWNPEDRVFRFVMPPWMNYQYIEDRGMLGAMPDGKQEAAVFGDDSDDSFKFNGRMLWPGSDAVRTGVFVYSEETNTTGGVSVARDDVADASEFKEEPLKELTV